MQDVLQLWHLTFLQDWLNEIHQARQNALTDSLALQFKINEVFLRKEPPTRVPCACFIRKAFVSDHAQVSNEEVCEADVDADGVFYCSHAYRHADGVSPAFGSSVHLSDPPAMQETF